MHYENLFLMPKCQCPIGFEGNFCEKKIKNECENDVVVKNDEVETSKCGNGTCVFNEEEGSISCM